MIVGKVGMGKSTYIKYICTILQKIFDLKYSFTPLEKKADSTVTKKLDVYSLQFPNS